MPELLVEPIATPASGHREPVEWSSAFWGRYFDLGEFGGVAVSDDDATASHTADTRAAMALLLIEALRGRHSPVSRIEAFTDRPQYRELITIGRPALGPILTTLRDRGGFWYEALRAITGADPVPRESRGNIAAMKRAWMAWGERERIV